VVIRRNSSGVIESPRPRMMLAMMLYSPKLMQPMKMICR